MTCSLAYSALHVGAVDNNLYTHRTVPSLPGPPEHGAHRFPPAPAPGSTSHMPAAPHGCAMSGAGPAQTRHSPGSHHGHRHVPEDTPRKKGGEVLRCHSSSRETGLLALPRQATHGQEAAPASPPPQVQGPGREPCVVGPEPRTSARQQRTRGRMCPNRFSASPHHRYSGQGT